MGPLQIILIAAGAVLLLFVIPVLAMSFVLYSILLLRTSKKKWGHTCSFPDDPEYVRMYNRGLEWEKTVTDKKRPVEVKSGRYRLVGEYFDFGADRAVLIIAGRTESYQYSYYFASGYEGKGYNVLVIDNRCHGDSDGRINRLGYGEYKDIIEWCRLLGRLGNKAVVLHGICIGASTALFAAVSEKCPDNVAAVVTEGMYVNFYESLKNHILEKKKPLFPILQGTAVHLFFISRANVVTDGPIKRIKKMRRPILMIQSRQDTYSLPELAQKLYDACPSENKKLVYFPVGAHSRVRINDERGYDEVVHAFLNKTLG